MHDSATSEMLQQHLKAAGFAVEASMESMRIGLKPPPLLSKRVRDRLLDVTVTMTLVTFTFLLAALGGLMDPLGGNLAA